MKLFLQDSLTTRTKFNSAALKRLLMFVLLLPLSSGLVHAQLSGTYLIGTSASADFPDIDSAITAMESQGLGGAVWFDLEPGTYNEQVVLDGRTISGYSASDSIVFDGGHPDSVAVISNARTIFLDSINYISIINMTIETTSYQAHEEAIRAGLNPDSASNNINVLNNVIIKDPGPGNDLNANGMRSFGDNHYIINNHFQGSPGYNYLAWGGENIHFHNNLLDSASRYGGMIILNVNNFHAHNNVIRNIIGNFELSSGIEIRQVNGRIELIGNEMYGIHRSGIAGVLSPDIVADSSNPSIIANNVITSGYESGIGDGIALSINDLEYMIIAYNSVYNENHAIDLGGNKVGIELYNNVFYGDEGSIELDNSTGIDSSDFNHFFGDLDYGSTTYTNLTGFQTASGLDANSQEGDPDYMDRDDDLAPQITSPLFNSATPLPQFTDDVRGNDRDAASPTIGAFECPGGFEMDDSLAQGQPFEGIWADGTESEPDLVCFDNTLTYEITAPAGMDNSQYNQNWTIADTSVETPYGTPLQGGFTFSEPSAGNPGTVAVQPDSSEIDSMFKVNVAVEIDTFGCTFSGSQSRYFQVSSPPQAEFNFTENACMQEDVTFDNTTSGVAGAEYVWDFGDGDSSFAESPIHAYDTHGVFQVTLKAQISDVCYTTHTDSIEIYPLPDANFSVEEGCIGDEFNFNNLSTGDLTPLSYIWAFGDGDSSQAENPVHTYDQIGTYNVTLLAENDEGCTNMHSGQHTVYDLPDPEFEVTNVCEGNEVHFNNTTQEDQSPYTYHWDLGDGDTSVLDNPSHLYDEAGTYEVTLTATSDIGCENTFTDTVEIYPFVDAGFSSAVVCLGEETGFVNETNYDTGTVTYDWDFGDGNSATDENPDHTYSDDGTYDVILTATSDLGCVDKDTAVAEVLPLPSTSFSANNVCLGNETDFDNQSSVDTGTLSYEWNFDDGNTSADEHPVHTYIDHGEYEVTLTATSSLGCVDSAKGTIEVYPNPEADFSAPDVCLGNETNFDNLTTIDEGVLSYQWELGDGTSTPQEHPSNTYNAPGTYEVTLMATSMQGCSDTIKQDVEVFDQPEAIITAPDEICFGEEVLFEHDSEVPAGAFNVYWDFGDGSTSQDESPLHTYDTAGTFVSSLVVETADGCSDTTYHNITVNPAPDPAITEADNACPGEEISFEYESGIDGDVSWAFGDGDSSTLASPVHIYDDPGIYEVVLEVETADGCSDTAMTYVEVYELPDAGFELTPRPDTAGVEVEANDPGLDTYIWDMGDDSVVTGISSFVYAYDSNKSYQITLTVTDINGCENTSLDTADITTVHTSQPIEAGQVQVTAYPNPFRNVTTVEVTLDQPEELRIEVYDIQGRKVTVPEAGQVREAGTYTYELALDQEVAASSLIVRVAIGDNSRDLIIQRME